MGIIGGIVKYKAFKNVIGFVFNIFRRRASTGTPRRVVR